MSSLRTTKKKEYENHLHAEEARWFAVCTAYRHEKMVAKRLYNKGIECYLPLHKKKKYYTRKVKEVELPLINCFVFVHITASQYVRVLETESVIRFLKISRNLLSIPASEIALLKRIVGESDRVEVDTNEWHAGDEVEVIGGELTGIRGQLVEKRSAKKLVVTLDTIGIGLQIEIAPKHLRKVPRPGSGKINNAE